MKFSAHVFLFLLLESLVDATTTECSDSWCSEMCKSTIADKCCKYRDAPPVAVMAPAHSLALDPLKDFESEFSLCTKSQITFAEVPMGDWDKEVENDVRVTKVYDGYVLKSVWYQTYSKLLEDMTARIQVTPELNFLDIAYVVRSELAAMNGTVLTMPIDADVAVFLSRRDLQDAGEKLDTIDQMLAFARRHDGKDLNEDGIPDYGVCMPSHSDNSLFAKLGLFVSPLVQSQGPSQGIFFDTDFFTPLVNTTAWLTGLRYAQEAIQMSQYREEGPRTWQTENAKFKEGRCALYIDLPGLLKSVAMQNISRTNSSGDVIWAAASDAQRHRPPGSWEVMMTESSMDANDIERRNYTMHRCQTKSSCPYSSSCGGNRSPFYGTGGFSMSIRKGASSPNKDLLWDFIVFMNHPDQSAVVATQTGFLDAWRNSHLSEASREAYINTGWKGTYIDEHFGVSSWVMSEEANAAMDLRIFGSADYISALERRFEQSTGWMQNEEGDYEQVDDPLDLATALDRVVEDWAILTAQNGGRLVQAELYRETLGLSPLVLRTKCVNFAPEMAIQDPRACDAFLKGICDAGYYLDFGNSPPTCEPCSSGSYSAQGTDYLGSCTACTAGYFSGPRAALCTPCSPGRFQSLEGQANCTLCGRGTFNSGTGQAECTQCMKGTFAAEMGSLQCDRCPLARYQQFPNSTSCHPCAEGMTTLEVGSEGREECVCRNGAFHDCGGLNNVSCLLGSQDPDTPGFCQTCPVGMVCTGPAERSTAMISILGGQRMHKLPILNMGSMAIGKVAYSCAGDESACPGASMYDSLDVMCEFGGIGVACAECRGRARFDGDHCIECADQGGPVAFFLLLILVIFAGIVLTFPSEPFGTYTEITVLKTYYGNLVSVNFSNFLNLLQTTMIFARMSIQWPTFIHSVFSSTGGLFDLKAFNLECISPHSIGPREFAVVRTMLVNIAPAFACIFFGVLFVVAGIGFKEGRRRFPDKNKVVAQILSVLLAFFMTIVNAAVNTGFAVLPHPGGNLFSIRAFPFVLTKDSETTPIRVVSIMGLVLWCAGGLAIITYILYQLPTHVSDPTFRLRTATLVARFKIETPWWMLVQLVQSLATVLCLSLFTDGTWQLAYVTLVTVTYITLLVSFKPYYCPLMYYSDLCITVGKLFILIIGNVFAVSGNGEVLLIVTVLSVYTLAVSSFLLALVLWIKFRLLNQKVDLAHFGEDLGGKMTNRLKVGLDLGLIMPVAQLHVDAKLGKAGQQLWQDAKESVRKSSADARASAMANGTQAKEKQEEAWRIKEEFLLNEIAYLRNELQAQRAQDSEDPDCEIVKEYTI